MFDTYSELRQGTENIWNLTQCAVVTVITGTFGVIFRRFKEWLVELGLDILQ